MYSRIALSTMACGLMLGSSAVFAESVHIRESASTRVKSDESGTVTTVEESRVEERSGGSNSTTTLRVQTDSDDDKAGTVIRSESFRRATCYAIPGGDSRCTEEISGNGQLSGNASAQVRINGKDWWSGWRQRILEASRKMVASESAEDRIETVLNRTEARLARRVCFRFDDDERESCLEAALDGEGSTMRLRLRDWIGRR